MPKYVRTTRSLARVKAALLYRRLHHGYSLFLVRFGAKGGIWAASEERDQWFASRRGQQHLAIGVPYLRREQSGWVHDKEQLGWEVILWAEHLRGACDKAGALLAALLAKKGEA